MTGAKRKLHLTLAALGFASLVLAGCTTGNTDDATGSASATATALTAAEPSASPSSTTLTDEELLAMMPEDAARGDLNGALAVAEFWISSLSTMYSTGDTNVIESLSLEACQYCDAQIANTRDVFDAGYEGDGGEAIVDPATVKIAAGDNEQIAYVSFEAEFSALSLIAADGSSTVSEDAFRATFWFDLQRSLDLWKVAGVEFEESD